MVKKINGERVFHQSRKCICMYMYVHSNHFVELKFRIPYQTWDHAINLFHAKNYMGSLEITQG